MPTAIPPRVFVTLDRQDPHCLACGAAMDPDDSLFCPQLDCAAAYMNDGLPNVESWPIADEETPEPNPVPTLINANNGVLWDWCSQHHCYEEDHPLGNRSCRTLGNYRRAIRRELARHLSGPAPDDAEPSSELLHELRLLR